MGECICGDGMDWDDDDLRCESKLGGGMIALIVICVGPICVIVALIICFCICCCRK